MFHIRCRKAVDHENRDIEIILLKREITAKLRKGYGQPCNFGAMSCETIARILVVEYNLTTCEVLEDGENGAIVTISE